MTEPEQNAAGTAHGGTSHGTTTHGGTSHGTTTHGDTTHGTSHGSTAGPSKRSGLRFRPASRVRVTAEAPRTADRWSAVPLSTRLVLTISALLAIGLTLGALITLTVLRANLLTQVDNDLYSLAWELDDAALADTTATNAPNTLPSNFYVRFAPIGGPEFAMFDRRASVSAGAPRLGPAPSPAEVIEAPRLEVVHGTTGHTWRALTVATEDPTTRGLTGVVTVALPLQSTTWALDRTGSALLATSAIILIVGVGASLVTVRRALRPLRNIEHTAGAIAQGDLSRRLPDLPVSTEVGSLARSLNVMLAQIEHAFGEREVSEQRMRRFISDASHELRTPLATIRGYAELYRMGGVTAEQAPDVFRRVESEAARMGELVNDLVQLARIDEGRLLEFTSVDLVQVAADTMNDMRALDSSRGARVVGTDGTPGAELAAPEYLEIAADENRVRQLVSNLVGNVLQHTPEGVPVEIAVGSDPAHPTMALVEVRDHGPGIPEDQRQRVFERFHRVDESRNRASGGSGLGLAIVSAIVEAHRGSVTAVETPGGGTTMRVLLPLTTPDAGESATQG